MSTIPIDDKLVIGPDRANIDARYKASNNRPYTSVAAAEAAINLVIGNVGLTVLVADENDPDYPKAKEYWVQPKGTTPETYGLVEKGAGVTDYADLDNKPTISDGGDNSPAIPLAGNVKVMASTASGDTAGVSVTQGQTAGEIEMQFTLPKGADGQNGITPTINPTTKHWMIGNRDTEVVAEGKDGTNGTNGIDGKSAYQQWLDEGNTGDETDFLNSLKAQIGKFIYAGYNATAAALAIGGTTTQTLVATGATDDSIVLMPNDGTTPTATMMFSVSVSDDPTPVTTYTYIGDVNVDASKFVGTNKISNDLTTGGSGNVLSAEQGKVLEGKLFKYVDFTPTLSDYNINSNNPTNVGTNYSYKHYLLAVNAGEAYYIGGSRGTVYYAFLSQEPQATSGETLVFATGYSSAILLRPSSLENGTWKTAYITIPEGCTYLWVDAPGSSSYSTYNVSRKREDKFVTEDNISFDSVNKEVIVTNESFNRYVLDGVNRWNKQTITVEDYGISGTNIGTSASYNHYLIAVQAGDVVCMATSAHNTKYQYALLTTNTGLEAGAALPLVTGTTPVTWSRTTDTGWVYCFVEIPEGCAYIWIDGKGNSDSNTRCYKSSNRIAYTDVIEESTDGSLIPSVAAVKSYAGRNETINNTNTDDAAKPLSAAMGKMLDDRFKEWIRLKRSYTASLSYSITTNGKLGTSSSYNHALIAVMAGDEYIIRCGVTVTRTLNYCFLTTKNFENTQGATLPLVEGTRVGTYNTGNQEAPQEKYIVIPDGCNYLIFDFINGKTSLYKRVEKDNLAVPKHYQDYIKAKSDVLLSRDIRSGCNGDSFMFFSDYHVNDAEKSYDENYGHAPSLMNYLTKNTNTKKVFFGGDVLSSPGAGFDIKYERFSQFIRNLKGVDFYPVVGNHEWRQESTINSETNSDYIKYDYNTLIKPFEERVNVAIDTNGNERPCYYFDNEAKKIRYVCLYAINPKVSSSYAYGFDYTTQINYLNSCISSLDNSWRIIVVQHIVYSNQPNHTYQDQQAINLSLTDVGGELYDAIINNNQNGNKPKIVLVLSGHTHVDYGMFIDDYCFSYVITCDKADAIATDDSGIEVSISNGFRLRNTIYEQAFDSIHYEPEHDLITGERIGWGRNRIVHMDVNSVAVGNTIELTETIDNVIAWASLTPDIATVDSSGVVTPIAEGDATIICYTAMVNEYDENTPELEKNGYVEYFHVKVTNGLA